jgi:transcriptional regulator with XRE-family HTH domain
LEQKKLEGVVDAMKLNAAPNGARHWLGQHIRALRMSKGLTLRDMVDSTGLSASTISKIENGHLSLTFDKLVTLADALDVSASQLLSRTDDVTPNGRRSITRGGAGEVYSTPQYTYHMLCADLAKKKVIPLFTHIEVQDRDAFGPLVRHEGEEFIYILEGEIELHTEFYETTTLQPGDSAYFDSRMGHALTCRKGNGRILWISIPDSSFGVGTSEQQSQVRVISRNSALPSEAKSTRAKRHPSRSTRKAT